MTSPPMLPLTPAVPVSMSAATYTFFGPTLEAYEFTDWITESLSWKQTCYIGDWSPLSKIIVEGPDALRFFSDLGVNSFAKFAIGQAKHVVMCNDQGKVAGEGIVMRLDEQAFKFTGGPVIAWAEYHFGRGDYDASLTHVGPQQFIFQVQGPNALHVLEVAIGASIRDIGFMRFRPAQIEGLEFLLMRQGMAGEIGYELQGPIEHAVAIYQRILEVGARFGIKQLGGRTKLVNHVEACFPTPTIDYVPAFEGEFVDWLATASHLIVPPALLFSSTGSLEVNSPSELFRSPFELGWGKNIRFDHDFVGRAALEREAADPQRTLVTLVWDSDDVIDVYASLFRKDGPLLDFMELPRALSGRVWADQVLKDGALVGCAMSRCYSVFFREMISLCVIDIAQAQIGNRVEVLWGRHGQPQKRIWATVAPAPYKSDNRRLDLTALPSYVP